MTNGALDSIVRVMVPHLGAVLVCAARLLPIVYLCPLFGAFATPSFVKWGLVLSLSSALHWAGGVGLPESFDGNLYGLVISVLMEALFGVCIGLLASLPFDAARMGGSLVDLFRGSSAEASLPYAGSKEAASGDFLYQLMMAVSVVGAGMPLVMAALWKSFGVVGLGTFQLTGGATVHLVQWAAMAISIALAVGAPIAGVVLAVDSLLALVSRAAPQMNVQDSGTPLRLLAGGAIFWLGLGVISQRLLSLLADVEGSMAMLMEFRP